jgi:pseudouridine synthase
MTEERLQKVMAAAGVGSRRACEQLIVAGKVQVNGHTVSELGSKVDPEQAQITVDGKPIHQPKRHLYMKLHKPRGVLGDIGEDPEARSTILDLLPTEMRRVYPVGRLDLHSEGLVLLTDDGELAHKLTHPSFEHSKTYYVLVEQRPTAEAMARFRHGIELPEGLTAPADIRVADHLPAELQLSKGPTEGVWLRVVLHEGKKRQVRHMTAAIGHPTLRLVRWAIGNLTLGKLKLGAHAPLTRAEITALRQLTNPGWGRDPAQVAEQRPPSKQPYRPKRKTFKPTR